MIEKFKKWIQTKWTYPLFKRVIIWNKYIRLFCDGGQPIWYWVPRFKLAYYSKYWGLKGITMHLWGRQLCLIIGRDRNNLYKETNLQYFGREIL